MTKGVLQIDRVTKSYGAKKILDDISFTAEAGEFIVLVGPSGCGKSTLLRSIAGLEEVDSGSISISGQNVTHRPPKDRNIAMVFQDYALYPHMTVSENISFGLKIRKVAPSEIERRVGEAAEKLGLQDYLNRKPKALSGGQRQRVAIGRAIVRKPDVFLFDEPLSNLDAKLRGQMRIRIARLHNELQTTAVYVTHDQTEAMTLASRIIVLNQGQIQQEGHPLDIYEKPVNRFVATFIGSPAMNLIDGNMDTANGRLRFSTSAGLEIVFNDKLKRQIEGVREGSRVITWGLRPECLVIARQGESADFEAEVEVVEPLGSSTTVICSLYGEEIHVNLKDGDLPAVGQRLPLRYVGSQLYAFDGETGRNIRIGEQS